jgi:hypothetical protein
MSDATIPDLADLTNPKLGSTLLLDYFAGQVLNALVLRAGGPVPPLKAAQVSYTYARAMLLVRASL